MNDLASSSSSADRHDSIRNLSRDERFALVRALFDRHDKGAAGREAFRKAYPTAPEAMINTAAFHVYVDGCGAALDFLADAERFLRDPTRELDYGIAYEVLYHLYNWHQFRTLLPEGKAELLELVKELKQFVEEDDREATRSTAQNIEEILGGGLRAPEFD